MDMSIITSGYPVYRELLHPSHITPPVDPVSCMLYYSLTTLRGPLFLFVHLISPPNNFLSSLSSVVLWICSYCLRKHFIHSATLHFTPKICSSFSNTSYTSPLCYDHLRKDIWGVPFWSEASDMGIESEIAPASHQLTIQAFWGKVSNQNLKRRWR